MSKSKYEMTIEILIDKMSEAIEQCLAIIEQDIDMTISDDKMHNVLKGKRMATEDAIFYAKQIDVFEKELDPEYEQIKEVVGVNTSPQNIKRYTKK